MAFIDNPLGIENVNDAQEAVARPDADTVQRNVDFYYGDHWQDANAWSGPIPAIADSDYGTVREEIFRGFKSKNVVKEVVDRASNGITGKTPLFDLVPRRKVTADAPITDEEQTLIDEAKELLQEWMDDKEFQKYLSMCLRQTLLSGKSTLRLFVPAGFVQQGAMIVNTDNPIEHVYLDAPSPLAATVLTDANTREKVGIFLGSMGEEDTAELSYLLPLANEKGQRLTEIVVIIGKSNMPMVEEVQLDLGGRLPMYETEFPRLATEQVISLQKGINLNLTMMERNSVLGGFLERVILNGQLPAHFETDEDGERVLVRDEFLVGAGSVNAIQGNPIIDENTGNITNYTSPNVVYKDPQNPTTFLTAADAMYQMILQECDQMYAVSVAQASGDAQRQAVASFFSYLKTPKQQMDKAGKWTLETVLAYAAFLQGNAGKYDALKVNFETRLDTGSLPTGEMDILERWVRIGIMSLETARERAGIEDPDLESRRVEGEKELRSQNIVTDNQSSVETGQTIENVDNKDKTEGATE